jgi:hypothetical protein
MEAICFSETPVDFQRTTRRYVPEDITLQVFLGSNYFDKDSVLTICTKLWPLCYSRPCYVTDIAVSLVVVSLS